MTIPRSGSRAAGSRSPKQETWGGGRKAGGAEWALGLPELCSGCGERIRKQPAGVQWGRGRGSSPSAQPQAFSSPSAPAQQGRVCPGPAQPHPPWLSERTTLPPYPTLPSWNNCRLQANSIKLIPATSGDASPATHWSPGYGLWLVPSPEAPPFSGPLGDLI